MLSFTIDKRVFDTLTSNGRITHYITSQLLCNGMDPDVAYDVLDDEKNQVVRISQGTENEDSEVREEEAV